MLKVDMWYGDRMGDSDRIDIVFYDNAGEYRGNVYKDGRAIGDYVCDNSLELEKSFSQLNFSW